MKLVDDMNGLELTTTFLGLKERGFTKLAVGSFIKLVTEDKKIILNILLMRASGLGTYFSLPQELELNFSRAVDTVSDEFYLGDRVQSKGAFRGIVTGYEEDPYKIVCVSEFRDPNKDRTRYAYLPQEIMKCKTVDEKAEQEEINELKLAEFHITLGEYFVINESHLVQVTEVTKYGVFTFVDCGLKEGKTSYTRATVGGLKACSFNFIQRV